MSSSYSIGILFMLVAVCAGQVDLTCNRIPSAVTECPASQSSATPLTQAQCEQAGCYYCSALTPSCIEGAGCARLPLTIDDECLAAFSRIKNKFICFLQTCSWCESAGLGQIYCFKNPTSPTQIAPSPICTPPKSTPEYDCRNNPTETPTAIECIQRPGCSWCPNNAAFQCVKDASLFTTPPPPTSPTSPTPPTPPPSPDCIGNETLHCFPYPTCNVSQAKCESMLGCAYCANATEDKRCMISKCPSGWEIRKDGKSCCKSLPPPPPSNGTMRMMSWLVEYRVGSTVCEGFAVTSTRVITAGQCLTTSNNGTVLLGNIYSDSDNVSAATITQVSQVLRFHYYINYNPYHDLMLLKLTTPLPSTVKPLSLPFGEMPRKGMTCYIGTFQGSSLVDYEAIIDCDSNCLLNDERFEKDFQACVKINGSCTCVGKIGTPIVCQRCSSCEWYAYGIKSYSLECTNTSPTYITQLSPYAKFLHDHGVPMSNNTYSCMH